MNRDELATKIYDVAHLTGTFKLRSGKTSNVYFDKYQFESRPDLLDAISDHLLPLIPKDTELLGGLELGGVPIAAAISLKSKIPTVFLRKEAKAYGTCKFAEGPLIQGKKICLIEDIITTGGQVAITTEMLRASDAKVSDVLCVIDRSMGQETKLEKANLKLQALFTMNDILP